MSQDPFSELRETHVQINDKTCDNINESPKTVVGMFISSTFETENFVDFPITTPGSYCSAFIARLKHKKKIVDNLSNDVIRSNITIWRRKPNEGVPEYALVYNESQAPEIKKLKSGWSQKKKITAAALGGALAATALGIGLYLRNRHARKQEASKGGR